MIITSIILTVLAPVILYFIYRKSSQLTDNFKGWVLLATFPVFIFCLIVDCVFRDKIYTQTASILIDGEIKTGTYWTEPDDGGAEFEETKQYFIPAKEEQRYVLEILDWVLPIMFIASIYFVLKFWGSINTTQKYPLE